MARTKAFRCSALVAALALLWSASGCSHEARRPNVLLVSIDMLRADHLSCYGYERPTSPAIDRLAAEGQLFESHVSSSSWTLPGHASLFTSLPDSVHGAVDTSMRLADATTTLAERFRAAGYRTAGFYAGPYLYPVFGLDQGFAQYVDCTSYGAKYAGRPVDEWAADKGMMQASHEDVTNPAVYAAFSRWFAGRGAEPFFAFVHLWDVHYDFLPPPPWDKRFDPDYDGPVTGKGFQFDPAIGPRMAQRDLQHLLALYDGEIGWTDTWIARIRADLEAAGVLEDTIVVVTSDHGTEFFEHGGKGHRKTLHDEVVRIPLVIRWPKALPAGGRVRAQTRSIDVGPTLLELAGLPAADDVVGSSLLPIVRDPASQPPRRAVLELSTLGLAERAVRTNEWKLVDAMHAKDHYWFDLVVDPREQLRRGDFDSPRGKELEDAYLAEVEALEAFMGAHPPVHERSDVPDAVKRSLQQFGYVGEDEPARPR